MELQSLLGWFFSTWQRLIDIIFLLACVSWWLEMSMVLCVYEFFFSFGFFLIVVVVYIFAHIVNNRITLGMGYTW